jgi:hypothetical protein
MRLELDAEADIVPGVINPLVLLAVALLALPPGVMTPECWCPPKVGGGSVRSSLIGNWREPRGCETYVDGMK